MLDLCSYCFSHKTNTVFFHDGGMIFLMSNFLKIFPNTIDNEYRNGYSKNLQHNFLLKTCRFIGKDLVCVKHHKGISEREESINKKTLNLKLLAKCDRVVYCSHCY